jgi:hypothetical protein
VSPSSDNGSPQTPPRRAWLGALGERLPRLRQRVRLELYPQRAVAACLGVNGAVKVRRTVTCDPAGDAEAPAWTGVLAALESLLALPEFRHACAEVILSNHFVRYATIPWREDLAGDAERLAFVRHCFAKVYGARAEGWELRLSETRYGLPAVASAVEPALLEALRSATRAARLRLESVEPFLAAAFNRSRAQIAGERFWFVAAEKGRACVAHVDRGGWQSLRCQRIGEDWTRELPLLLTRERLLGDGAEAGGRVYLYAPGLTGTGLLAGEWALTGLKMPPEAGIAEPAELVAAGATEEQT